jgi:hypothetical protein
MDAVVCALSLRAVLTRRGQESSDDDHDNDEKIVFRLERDTQNKATTWMR